MGLDFASAGAWTTCITVITGEFTHEKFFFKNVFYFVVLKQKKRVLR